MTDTEHHTTEVRTEDLLTLIELSDVVESKTAFERAAVRRVSDAVASTDHGGTAVPAPGLIRNKISR